MQYCEQEQGKKKQQSALTMKQTTGKQNKTKQNQRHGRERETKKQQSTSTIEKTKQKTINLDDDECGIVRATENSETKKQQSTSTIEKTKTKKTLTTTSVASSGQQKPGGRCQGKNMQ